MTRRRPPFRRILLAFALLAATAVSTVTDTTAARPSASFTKLEDREQANTNFPEVRIRKLHLVRPDLIPYPLVHDVYC